MRRVATRCAAGDVRRRRPSLSCPVVRRSSGDRQGVADALELLADPRSEAGRGRAHAADLAAAAEIVRAVQGDVLGRLLAQVEEGDPELRGVLLLGSAADPLHAGIIGHLLFLLVEHLAALDLEAAAAVLDIVEAAADERV